MVNQIKIMLPPFPRGFHLITHHIDKVVSGLLPESGILHVFICHTSAGLTINENADPSVRVDFEQVFNRMVKENESYYTHTFEGSDDLPAHIKSTLSGSSVTIPVVEGGLGLGTWQGIYLCEFRNNGGGRKLILSIMT